MGAGRWGAAILTPTCGRGNQGPGKLGRALRAPGRRTHRNWDSGPCAVRGRPPSAPWGALSQPRSRCSPAPIAAPPPAPQKGIQAGPGTPRPPGASSPQHGAGVWRRGAPPTCGFFPGLRRAGRGGGAQAQVGPRAGERGARGRERGPQSRRVPGGAAALAQRWPLPGPRRPRRRLARGFSGREADTASAFSREQPRGPRSLPVPGGSTGRTQRHHRPGGARAQGVPGSRRRTR